MEFPKYSILSVLVALSLMSGQVAATASSVDSNVLSSISTKGSNAFSLHKGKTTVEFKSNKKASDTRGYLGSMNNLFPDEGMREQLKKTVFWAMDPEDFDHMRDSDFASYTQFGMGVGDGQKPKSLEGIQYFKNLESFGIAWADLSSPDSLDALNKMAEHSKLDTVYINDNHITDISYIKNLKLGNGGYNLLYLDNNNIADISSINPDLNISALNQKITLPEYDFPTYVVIAGREGTTIIFDFGENGSTQGSYSSDSHILTWDKPGYNSVNFISSDGVFSGTIIQNVPATK